MENEPRNDRALLYTLGVIVVLALVAFVILINFMNVSNDLDDAHATQTVQA